MWCYRLCIYRCARKFQNSHQGNRQRTKYDANVYYRINIKIKSALHVALNCLFELSAVIRSLCLNSRKCFTIRSILLLIYAVNRQNIYSTCLLAHLSPIAYSVIYIHIRAILLVIIKYLSMHSCCSRYAFNSQ